MKNKKLEFDESISIENSECKNHIFKLLEDIKANKVDEEELNNREENLKDEIEKRLKKIDLNIGKNYNFYSSKCFRSNNNIF